MIEYLKMENLRILHSPRNIGNQAYLLAKGLREYGIFAESMIFSQNWLDYPSDYFLDIKKGEGRLSLYSKKTSFFLKNLLRFNVYHFHYAESLLPRFRDLPILKMLGKKIVFHFRGSDIRNPDYLYSLDKTIEKSRLDGIKTLENKINPAQKSRLRAIKKFSNKMIVSTPDLIEIVGKEATFLPNVVDIEVNLEEDIRIKNRNKKLKIIHSPTKKGLKGTNFIIKTINQIQKKYKNIELILVEGVKPNDARRIYQQADIAIDQILVGWYGNFSIETMALGVPTLCYVREDLKKRYAPDLPIISVTADTLKDSLEEILEDADLRRQKSLKCKLYVKKVHSKEAVIPKLIDLYTSL